ncbi:nitrous oxide reductase accessory protein NosL [Thauera sp. Sel9]|uniref:nitrous oxide reductase accessory protein NosL n=1 Tax=Thauera sp. Sel9 TaxID=2974299 RepID=UPI0021E11B8E|nr:nitrous oxide reductase accessory protein NosL [Thauera sp. Sel9]MCV2219797.1 nitrous oxide reductase accessory protein NosL [Thauera sp. Sel9]
MNLTGRRLLLLGAAVLCTATAGALFAQFAAKGKTAEFVPPAEDICIVAPARVSAAHPYDPASGLDMLAARPVPADARCPVCGMYPARFPNWAAQLIFSDGSAHFFDSPVDLFVFLDEPARFDAKHTAEDAAALYVADHRSGSWLDARKAVFVIGSGVRGPMRGPDLPAFAEAAAALAFIAEHGGRALAFDEIGRSTVHDLRNAAHGGHGH